VLAPPAGPSYAVGHRIGAGARASSAKLRRRWRLEDRAVVEGEAGGRGWELVGRSGFRSTEAQRRRWRGPDLERVAAVQGLVSLPSSPCMAGARIWVYASRGGERRRGLGEVGSRRAAAWGRCWGRKEEQRLGLRGTLAEESFIYCECDPNHQIKMDGHSNALLVFLFRFSFLLHHCEVTLKNNYVICTNIFFIYNSMNTSFHLGVSRFFEWISYFLSFKWISTCLPKVIQNWPICASNKFKKFKKNIFRRLWSILGHI
jgi:hypothetical protein